MISDATYMEFLESCAAFNKRISRERKHRLPFLDPQTGVAQNPSNLWRSKRERRPGADPSVVFTYPAKRWKKKKSTINLLVADIKCVKTEDSLDAGGAVGPVGGLESEKITPIELKNPETKPESGEKDTASNRGDQTGWYDDLSDQGMDDYEEPSDGDDYEDTIKSKKKSAKKKVMPTKGTRKPRGGGSDQQQSGTDLDIEKPHSCQYCGAKYKTKPGLHYHLTHVHTDMMEQPPPMPMNTLPPDQFGSPPSRSSDHYRRRSPSGSGPTSSMSSGKHQQHHYNADISTPPHLSNMGSGGGRSAAAAQPVVSQYCDFCLGDAMENKKTNQPEELISCKDCGRSGHPTCLQFTPNMIISTKRHGWQCIECKSCAVCGTSENDDQLLFCDDCDRGFHMYCLKPPLSAPPDGNWSCHLCVVEFGPNASNPGPSSR